MMSTNTDNIPKDLEWEGKNMEAVKVLLEFLDQKLSPVEVSIVNKKKKPKTNVWRSEIFA